MQTTIHQQPDSVRSAMNNFMIAVGSYVQGLTEFAVKAAMKVGQVTVDMGDTACKVPSGGIYREGQGQGSNREEKENGEMLTEQAGSNTSRVG